MRKPQSGALAAAGLFDGSGAALPDEQVTLKEVPAQPGRDDAGVRLLPRRLDAAVPAG
jgi:hypothetical protein